MLALLALALAACAGSSEDKAGGTDQVEPRVLTMASQSGPPSELTAFADEVNRRSNGTLRVEFKAGWRLGEPTHEAGTIEDVRAGEVDMAWVGARVFDTVGVKSFQALAAPLLIDSYELEAKVFEQGIPRQMLESVSDLDLVGIGVLPGPMRKVLGVSQAFTRPADFAGQVVGLQDSVLAEKTLKALRAEPRPVPAEAQLDGLDAYEQQLDSIAGNSYDESAEYVTANLNLWPRPLVIVMGKESFASLTPRQQSALKEAADAAIPEALAASRKDDEEAASKLCRRGVTFAAASESDLSELRAAFGPVYADLAADPRTKSYVDAITGLKTEVAASAAAPVCASDFESGQSSSEPTPIDGIYRASFAKQDLANSPLLYDPREANDENWGDLTLTLDEGRVTFEQLNDVESTSTSGTFALDGDSIVLDFTEGVNAGETFVSRWSLFRDELTFNRDEALGEIPTPYVIEPWERVG